MSDDMVDAFRYAAADPLMLRMFMSDTHFPRRKRITERWWRASRFIVDATELAWAKPMCSILTRVRR